MRFQIEPYKRADKESGHSFAESRLVEGNTRIVEIHAGYVLKIAKNAFGIKANRKEVELTDKSTLFAKVIDYSPDYFYLVMEKVSVPGILKRHRIAKAIRKKLAKTGIRVSDVMWYNVGEREDGSAAVFDYGGSIVSLSGFLWRIRKILGVDRNDSGL